VKVHSKMRWGGRRRRWGAIGKFVKKGGKAVHKHVLRPIANAACSAAAETVKGALSFAKGRLKDAQNALHGVNKLLDVAKKALDVAKAAWKGVWNLIKKGISAALGVTYVKIFARLSLNLLDTCIGGQLRYDLAGRKNLRLSGEFCLKNLFKIIGDLFKACERALTRWAGEQEEELFQIEQHEVEEYGKQLDLQFEVSEVENLPDIYDVKMVFQPLTNQSNNTNQTADLYTVQDAGAVNDDEPEEMLVAQGQ